MHFFYCTLLESVGFGIANLPALAEVSVAGAIQTGVHGSGLPNANLATHVRSVQMVLADGSIAKYGPDDEELKGIAVGLGAFGVITQVELKLEPTFNTITTIFLKYAVNKRHFFITESLTNIDLVCRLKQFMIVLMK